MCGRVDAGLGLTAVVWDELARSVGALRTCLLDGLVDGLVDEYRHAA